MAAPTRQDPPAFDVAAMVRRHQAALWRFLRVLGCDPQLADELAQDTFVSVLQRPFAVRDDAATGAYLRTVAKHLLLKARRSAARRPAPADLDLLEAAFVAQGGDAGDLTVDALRACVGELEGRSRALVDSCYRDGESRQSLARRFFLSEDGIKSWLRRLRAALRRCVERRLRA